MRQNGGGVSDLYPENWSLAIFDESVQCQLEELKLITTDGMMSNYDVEIVW